MSIGAIGLNTMGGALGNIVRTEATIGSIGLKITGRIVGNISRAGVAVSVGSMIFGGSLTKIVRVEVTADTIGRNNTGMRAGATLGTTIGTTGPRIAGRALGSITSARAALGALTRPLDKIVGAGGTRGGIVLVSPVFPLVVLTVAVLVGLPSGVGARGTVYKILGIRLFPSWFVVGTIVAGTMLIRGGSPIHSLHHSQVTS